MENESRSKIVLFLTKYKICVIASSTILLIAVACGVTIPILLKTGGMYQSGNLVTMSFNFAKVTKERGNISIDRNKFQYALMLYLVREME